jgi:preprotein translocase subunit SecA
MAQRDPLVEYQREGFDMFNAMLDAIKEESVEAVEDAPVVAAPMVARPAPALSAKGLQTGGRSDNLQYSAPTLDSTEPERTATGGSAVRATGGAAASGGEPGRNAPCPCGSGKKYKRCHGAPAAAR